MHPKKNSVTQPAQTAGLRAKQQALLETLKQMQVQLESLCLQDSAEVLRESNTTAASGSENALVHFKKIPVQALPTDDWKEHANVVAPIPAGATWLGLRPDEPLWVRDSYLDLWDVVSERLKLKRSSGLIVIGNPGIGKSVGGINTVAAMSIEQNAQRLVVVVRDHESHIFVDGSWWEAPDETPALHAHLFSVLTALKAIASRMPIEDGFSRPQLLLLHDIKSTTDSISFPYQSWFVSKLDKVFDVHCVLFASPEERTYAECEKDFSRVRRFYMPPWSLEALEAINDCFELPPGVTVAQRFKKVGGIVRRFDDEDALSDVVSDRKEALMTGTIALDVNRRGEFPSTATHKLFQLVPSEENPGYAVTFLCDDARDAWLEARQSKFVQDSRIFLESAIQSKCTADVIGRLLEGAFRHRLRHDDRRHLTLTYLGDGNQRVATLSTLMKKSALQSAGPFATRKRIAVLDLPALRVTELIGQGPDGISSEPGLLYVPENSNYPFLDFVFVNADKEAWVFQVTVSDDHKNSFAFYTSFMTHCRKIGLRPRVVWVGYDDTGISTLQHCDDTAKTPIKMPQFSLKLGIKQTEVWVKEQGNAKPFYLLLSADGKTVVTDELQRMNLTLQSKKTLDTSSPAKPWIFKER